MLINNHHRPNEGGISFILIISKKNHACVISSDCNLQIDYLIVSTLSDNLSGKCWANA